MFSPFLLPGKASLQSYRHKQEPVYACVQTQTFLELYSEKIKTIKHKLLLLPATKLRTLGASLVAQWLRVCLPMKGTWVRALVWEDPTCRGAAGPVSHNY